MVTCPTTADPKQRRLSSAQRWSRWVKPFGPQVLDLSRIRGSAIEKPDHRQRRLLRTQCERPYCYAAEKCDELPALHSTTSSARASRIGGTSMPSVLAVLRLMISSNFVGCSIGRSAGFAPFITLTTNAAARL